MSRHELSRERGAAACSGEARSSGWSHPTARVNRSDVSMNSALGWLQIEHPSCLSRLTHLPPNAHWLPAKTPHRLQVVGSVFDRPVTESLSESNPSMIPHRKFSFWTRFYLQTNSFAPTLGRRIGKSNGRQFARLIAAAMSTLLFVGGCTEAPEITRRTVPKPTQILDDSDTVASVTDSVERPFAPGQSSAAQRPASTKKIDGRMLAAVVPAGGQAWFFKISGAAAAVVEQTGKFESLLKTLTIAGGKPVWKTPDGWNEEGASGMRAATFTMGAANPPLECSVIGLPSDEPESDEYLLDNINRWRRQLGLGSQTIDELKSSDEFQQFALADGTTINWVNLVGKVDAPADGGPSAARQAASAAGPALPPGHPPTGGASTAKTVVGPAPAGGSPPAGDGKGSPASIPEMSFEVPAGWVAGKLGPFRKIAWNINHDGKTAEFYISALAAAGSDIGDNVNRWRGQAGLEKLSEQGLSNEVEDMSIGGKAGGFIECSGEKKSIIGAIVVNGDTGWFFKLVGDPDAVSREKDNVRAFLKSVKFQ